MFADYVKMAAKIALVVVITTAVVALFSLIQIPQVSWQALTPYLIVAYTFAVNWCPAFTIIFPIALTLIALEVGLMTFRISAVAWKWIFKINE